MRRKRTDRNRQKRHTRKRLRKADDALRTELRETLKNDEKSTTRFNDDRAGEPVKIRWLFHRRV
jgi:hypothetical protein